MGGMRARHRMRLTDLLARSSLGLECRLEEPIEAEVGVPVRHRVFVLGHEERLERGGAVELLGAPLPRLDHPPVLPHPFQARLLPFRAIPLALNLIEQEAPGQKVDPDGGLVRRGHPLDGLEPHGLQHGVQDALPLVRGSQVKAEEGRVIPLEDRGPNFQCVRHLGVKFQLGGRGAEGTRDLGRQPLRGVDGAVEDAVRVELDCVALVAVLVEGDQLGLALVELSQVAVVEGGSSVRLVDPGFGSGFSFSLF